MRPVPPSALARRIASLTWPNVQHSYRLAPGVYEHICAGHGGIVALEGAADIPADIFDLAARHHLVHQYVLTRSGRRSHLSLARHHTPDIWATWCERPAVREATIARGRVWIGEEDADWATIIATTPALNRAWINSRTGGNPQGDPGVAELAGAARANLERWNPTFLAELDTLLHGATLAPA